MKFYQCMVETTLLYYYNNILLRAGQLIRATDDKLIQFLDSHRYIREINDDKMKRLAPPIHLIQQPEDPMRMRKEDIINELRSYGIFVDPYTFSEQLSMQLKIARKKLNRNFLTILNEKGMPIYVDQATIPIPALSLEEDALTEPDDPKGEFFVVSSSENESNFVEKTVGEKQSETAMSVDPIEDEDAKANEGKVNFEEWVDNTEERKQVDTEKELIEMQFEEKEPEVDTIEKEEEVRDYGLEDSDIKEENFRYLVDTKQDKPMLLDEISEDDIGRFRDVKWTKINIDVLTTFLRNKGIVVEYKSNEQGKRWKVVDEAKKYLETSNEKDKDAVSINLLQKRHDEITKMEPNYRKSTGITLKRKATELTKYGLDVWYNKDQDMRKFCQKIYTIAKLGLQMPETEEEVDKLLLEHKKDDLVK